MDFFCQRSARARTETKIAALSLYCPRQNSVTINQVVREVVSKKQRGSADPAFPAVPAFHVRRREKDLSHLPHGILRNVRSRQLTAEHLAGLNNELGGAFDLRSHNPLRIKFLRAKDLPEQWLHFEIVRAHSLGHQIDQLHRWFVLDEIPANFSTDEFRTGRLFG